MAISIDSTSDSPEAVTAALGDLAQGKTIEAKSEEKLAEASPKEGEPEVDPETEELTEADESSADEEEAETEELEAKKNETQEAKPKKKGGFQKRIDKLNTKLSAIEQEREYWKQEALKKPSEKTDTTTQAKPDLSKRPKTNDYASHDEYVEALTDWKLDQKLTAEKQRQAEDAIKNEAQSRIGKHSERVNVFKEAHDDFEDVIENVAKIPISLTVQEAIIESDLGPELMYELAKDPKEFKRICEMKPIQAAKEIGKLESRLSKPASETPEKKTTKAPPPVTPVRSRGTAIVKDIYRAEEMTQAEWNRMRDEQERSRSAGR